MMGSRAIAEDLRKKLRLPVIGAPMFLASSPELVIAQSAAGIVGSIPALNARPQSVLTDWIGAIQSALAEHDRAHPEAPAAPFAVNQIAHRTNERLADDMAVIAEHTVPIVIVSLAAPTEMIETVHGYGGLVFNDVVSDYHARKCADAGADGLVAVAAGAGGHTGTVSPFALVEEIRQWWDGPLALSGCIATGRAIYAAQVMGADFAYIGTPFLASPEANVADGYREMVVEARERDVLLTHSLTGVKATFLKPSVQAAGLDPAELAASGPGKKEFGSGGSSQKAWRDIWSAGQGVGAVREILPVAERIARLADEYEAARRQARD